MIRGNHTSSPTPNHLPSSSAANGKAENNIHENFPRLHYNLYTNDKESKNLADKFLRKQAK